MLRFVGKLWEVPTKQLTCIRQPEPDAEIEPQPQEEEPETGSLVKEFVPLELMYKSQIQLRLPDPLVYHILS